MSSIPRRQGVSVLELILALPILIITIMGIVEFGMLSQNQSVLHAASRAATDAAISVGSQLSSSPSVPTEVVDAANKVLRPRGISASCVRLEFSNVGGGTTVLVSGGPTSPPAAPIPAQAVCVSVCVENTQLAPNLLKLFCIDLNDTYSQHTVCRCLQQK